jgi:cytochrome c oxidase subunit 1
VIEAAVTRRRLLAPIAVRGPAGPRIGLLFAATGLALVAVMGLLGIALRASQGEVVTLSSSWFYRVMTLHGAGMLVGALLAQMGGMWFAVRSTVPLSAGRALAAYSGVVGGALLVLVATLVGGFAPGWTFLWPLPFESRGGWETWSTATFLVGMVVVGVGFTVYCIDLLAKASATYGGLARVLGISYLRKRDDDPPPPQVIGCVVVALAGLVASAAGVTILAALLSRLFDTDIVIDALWAKNLTYFFGHTYANLIIYLAVGVVYVLVPKFTGRQWKTTTPIVIGWLATLTFVLTAYGHHLYMDFVQPRVLSVVGTISSSAAALPVLVVTIYTGMLLVWGSRYRWTLGSTLLYLGFAGWAIGGAGAVLDSFIPVNFRLHNTVWVPAHFHTYLLVGVVFWAMAFVAYRLEQRAGRSASVSLRVAALAPMVAGGFGLVAVWYVAGALGVPRRYAAQPFGSTAYSVAGLICAVVFAVGFLAYLAALIVLWRAGSSGTTVRSTEEASEPAPPPRSWPLEAPVRSARELFTLGLVATVSLVALLPPAVEAAESSVRWHHLTHAAMFIAGAAGAAALLGVRDVWDRIGRGWPTLGLVLVVLAPLVSLLAMTPRFYEPLEDEPALHFAYHMVFFVGLGAQTAIAAAWLGRTAGWVVALLAAGMGVLYAAGVLGG